MTIPKKFNKKNKIPVTKKKLTEKKPNKQIHII